MGLGPGKLDGAYAQLPRYFPDTRKVMDAESRLVHCMVSLARASRKKTSPGNWFSKPGQVNPRSRPWSPISAQNPTAMKIDVPARHPEEARMAKVGE
jgi:sulfur-oxidizing protein SoxA